ncbi:MAG: hypothetical protein ACK4RV_05790 [Caulobacter sp.]
MRGFLIGAGAGVIVTLGLALWAVTSSLTVVLLHNAGDLPLDVVARTQARELHSGWMLPGAWRVGVGRAQAANLVVVCTVPTRAPTDNAVRLAGGFQVVTVDIQGCSDIRWRVGDLP